MKNLEIIAEWLFENGFDTFRDDTGRPDTDMEGLAIDVQMYGYKDKSAKLFISNTMVAVCCKFMDRYRYIPILQDVEITKEIISNLYFGLTTKHLTK